MKTIFWTKKCSGTKNKVENENDILDKKCSGTKNKVENEDDILDERMQWYQE